MLNEANEITMQAQASAPATATKKRWQAPQVIVASADDTETNIATGPEIIVLVS